MGAAKDIRVETIGRRDADRVIKALHYSGKVVNNSRIHFGVFLHGRCHGAMQFGPPTDWDKAMRAFPSLARSQVIELNRLAFGPALPRNSESRAIRYACRCLRGSGYKLIQSYADATQCGDGTIYRAAGFLLVGIKRNTRMWRLPTGEVAHAMVFDPSVGGAVQRKARAATGLKTAASSTLLPAWGAERLRGFQLRYLLPLTDRAREAIVLPALDYSEIDRAGARMYMGKRVGSIGSDAPGDQSGEGGATPTPTLQFSVG